MKYLGNCWLINQRIQLDEDMLDLLRKDDDDFLSVFLDDSKIIIKREKPYCTLCKTTENVKKMDPADMWCHLCPDCLAAFKKLEE